MGDDANVDAARERFEMLRARMNAMKIAYLNRTLFDGAEVGYDALKRVAQDTIDANYQLQRLLYGRVRLRLSVAKLLRRGR